FNRATITWQVDGKTVESGVGVRALSIRTGAVGASQTVTVLVRPSGTTDTLRATLTITPAEVDLLAESSSYTPEAYQGKALFTAGSQITITAIPNFVDGSGKQIPPEKLVYNWQRNFEGVSRASGYGKYTFGISGLKNVGS